MLKQQQIEALRVARMVGRGELSRAGGARLLSEHSTISAASAGIVIGVYINMSIGQVFKRTLSASDMNFIIDSIANEEDPVQFKKALSALRLHIKCRESHGVNPVKNRAILKKYEARLHGMATDFATAPVYFGVLESDFCDQVENAKRLSHHERQKRLSKAPKLPARVARLVYIFERNPDVVVEVLRRARGYCEGCDTKAPFSRRSNGTPYLEVHHNQPLSENGEDTVENAIALCPNCHRQSHFG